MTRANWEVWQCRLSLPWFFGVYEGEMLFVFSGTVFGDVPVSVYHSLWPTLFFGRVDGKNFVQLLGVDVKTLFSYFVSEIRGKCCAFFFCAWVGVLCRFFCGFLSLRVAVWNKFSGANFCFLWSVVVLGFFVLPRFSLHGVAPRSRNCSKKISLHVRSLFGINFRERTFVFCGRWWSCVFRRCVA